MSGIVASGINLLKAWVPPVGTVDRTICNIYIYSWALIIEGKENGRTCATYAALGLKGRLSVEHDPFATWMKNLCDSATIEKAKEKPLTSLLFSQAEDLMRKVIFSAGFYVTSHLSLYTTLSNLFSHSQTVSKVAQPLLDRIASMPIPRPLQSMQVIALAPLFVKLLHIALLAADPKGENEVLTLFKKSSEKVGRGLEALWCLRLSLISLGMSKNIYQSVASTLASQMFEYFTRIRLTKIVLGFFYPLIAPKPGEEPKIHQSFLHLFLDMDSYWPTLGFEIGLLGLWNALFASSDPYDISELEVLFNTVSALQGKNNPGAIDQVRQRIKQSVQSGKINTMLASKLEKLIPWLN